MLEPSADEIREWENAVTQFMIEYLGGLRDRPVYRHTSSREIRSGLDSKLPTKGTDFGSLLKVFRDTIVPFSRQNAHPRMFGYVQSPGTPIGAFADLLASTLNANLTIWRSAPAPVCVERDAFLNYQGSGAFGNRPAERPARRGRRMLPNAGGRSRGKNQC